MNKVSLDLLNVMMSIDEDASEKYDEMLESIEDNDSYCLKIGKEVKRIDHVLNYNEFGLHGISMYYLGLKHGKESKDE